MKLWRFGKYDKEDTKSYTNSLEPNRDSREMPELDYKCIWLLICTTYNQILPGTDLYLCVNERGEVALIALPDMVVSVALGKILYEQPHPSAVLIQQIEHGKDNSHLAPAIFTEKEAYAKTAITSAFNRGELAQGLKKHNWQKILTEITAKNPTYLNNVSYRQRINRIKILDKLTTEGPDDFQRITGYPREIPVFLYTSPDTTREVSKQEIQRELFVRQLLGEDNIKQVRNTLRMSPFWGHLQENDAFVHVINRAEIEIKLHMNVWPSFADILLNPEMAEFNSGPPPKIIFTSKGEEILRQTESRELAFSITTWEEPNIAQLALHVNTFKGQFPKDSVTTPSITIFRDEMGIHALRSKLFRISTASFSLGEETGSPVFLDALPTSQIPEITWKPIAEETTSEWWQTDSIAKKVLWLATHNLASHVLGNAEEVVYSVTPIGNDVIQVALLFDDLDEGAPYAFSIIKGAFDIRAIPVFTSGTYEEQSDGSLVPKKSVRLKNYCITRNGERIDILAEGHLFLFIRPIYITVICNKHEQPPIYQPCT